MNPTFQGFLFDGESLRTKAVTVTIAAGRLQGTGPEAPELLVDVSLADVTVSDRLADVPRYLYLPGGATIETPDNVAVDELLVGQRRGRVVALVHALEIHSRVAAAATVLLVASIAVSLWWGLPALALRAALAVPERIELQMGEAGLLAINRFLPDSALDRRARTRVQTQLDRLMTAAGIKQKPRLVFRSMGNNAPNAFALPGGIIIISDELVKLADSDEEIAAVLAHETGHWQRRHGTQGVLRSSAALLVVSTVTGDLSTLTTFAGTIPFTLLQRGYSREFEAEADRYAVDLLRRAGINPEHFASILDKLEKSRPATGRDITYLGTHPSTNDRIQRIAPGFVARSIPKAPADKPTPMEPFPELKTKEAVKVTRDNLDEVFTEPTVELGAGDHPPRPLTRQAPRYPDEMRKKSIAGRVTLEFIIDRSGNVNSVRIVNSTHKEFEEAAIAAVREWKFAPSEKGGRKVSVRSSQLLIFDPADDEAPKPTPSEPPTIELNPPSTNP